MIKILGNISAIICMILLFFNFILYLFKDIYFKLSNQKIKSYINFFLPILSKYNEFSIFLSSIFLLIHISCFFNTSQSINFNSFILVLLMIIIQKKFFSLPKIRYDYLKKISSYIILLFLLIHLYLILK